MHGEESQNWTRRGFLAGAAAIGVAIASASLARGQTLKRPNILLLIADDLGLQLGCYGDINARTPHLDALAARGVRFDHAYVTQPSCSPSRSSILTGLYPHQNGQIGLSHLGFAMAPDVQTLPTLLKGGGYRTGLLGKLHVKPGKNFKWDVWEGGFDGGVNWPDSTRDVRRTAKRAREFFEAGDEPFFLQVSYLDPHDPLVDQFDGLPEPLTKADDLQDLPPPEAGVDVAKRRARWASFYNCVHRLDAGIGLLMDELKASGKLENTLVIFIGDNGPPFHGMKCSLREMGTKAPLIIAGPGVERGGHREQLISAVDLTPTSLQAAGVASPHGIEGVALNGLLAADNGDAGWRTELFTEMTFHTPEMYLPGRAVTDGKWKLIHTYPSAPSDAEVFELYDLTTDPNEQRNLAAEPSHAAELERLKRSLAAWQATTNDPLLDAKRVDQYRKLHADGIEKAKRKSAGGKHE